MLPHLRTHRLLAAAVLAVAVAAVVVLLGGTADAPTVDSAAHRGPDATAGNEPVSVLGAVTERRASAPTTPVAPAPTEAAPPAAEPPPPEPMPAEPPSPAPPPTHAPPPEARPAGIDVTVLGDGTDRTAITVGVSGPGGDVDLDLGPAGGSASLDDLAPGAYRLVTAVEGQAPPPDGGTQLGGALVIVPADPVEVGPGQRLSATYDLATTTWTLVLR